MSNKALEHPYGSTVIPHNGLGLDGLRPHEVAGLRATNAASKVATALPQHPAPTVAGAPYTRFVGKPPTPSPQDELLTLINNFVDGLVEHVAARVAQRTLEMLKLAMEPEPISRPNQPAPRFGDPWNEFA